MRCDTRLSGLGHGLGLVRGVGLAVVLASVSGTVVGTAAAAPGVSAQGAAGEERELVTDAKRAALVGAVDLSLHGDDVGRRMIDAMARPLSFQEVAGSRTFNGEVIVHALETKKARAMSLVGPSVQRVSAFDEGYATVRVPAGLSEGEFAAALMATGEFAYAEPNWILYQVGTVPNDPQFGSSWQHNRLDSENAWGLHTGESDVIVAVCDSGVDLDHPDLAASLVPGYNSESNQAQADGGNVDDINNHGTFVAGCAAARGNNNQGVVGVGWNFSVMPIRVTNATSGNAATFNISEGAVWAADNGAQIVNASYSGGSSGSVQSTARLVRDRGGLLFWSSGNDNAFIDFDGADVVLVGSTTSSDNRSGFSNFGPAVDVTAPGSSVRSTRRGGGYGNGSGTSYASPIAAGVGAMIVSAGNGLNPLDVQDVLYKSVDDLGAPGRDDSFGRGRVNTFKAVQMAQTYVPRLMLPLTVDFESADWMGVFDEAAGDAVLVADENTTLLELSSGDVIESAALSGRLLNAFNGYFSVDLSSLAAPVGASLDVEFLDESGAWQGLYSYTSLGETLPDGTRVFVAPSDDFFWHGVQIRLASGGGTFLVDNVSLDSASFDGAVFPFADGFDAAMVSPEKWVSSEGVGVEAADGSYAAALSGDDVLVSRLISTVELPFESFFVSFDVSGEAGIGADDVLYVDVTRDEDVLGWTTAATISGDELAMSFADGSFVMDATDDLFLSTKAAVRLRVEGNDAFFVDNVSVSTEAPSSACSVVDYSAPFGSLDFADVSAFLALFAAQDLSADLDASGSLDFADVSSFLASFGAGCP